MKKKSSPIRRQTQWQGGRDGGDRHGRELQIVGPTSPSFTSRPQLPPEWTVVERPRTRTALSYGRVDKYYFEPGTGRQFRSLISIHKYLTEGSGNKKNPTMNRKPAPEQIQRQIVPHSSNYTSSDFRLPDGWVIDEHPRRNINYAGTLDRYYIEPGTGRRFRSLVSVQRYLRSDREMMLEPKPLEYSDQFANRNVTRRSRCMEVVPFGNHSMCLTNQTKRRHCNEVKDPMLDFTNRPEKVKWVLSGSSGNMFSAYMGGSAVPGQVRQKWSEAFVSFIQDRS